MNRCRRQGRFSKTSLYLLDRQPYREEQKGSPNWQTETKRQRWQTVVKGRQVVTNTDTERQNRTKTGTVRLLRNLDKLAECDYWLGTVYSTMNNEVMGYRCASR